MPESLVRFGIATALIVLIAHALAYLTHEYAHTFVAWALGWMADPLALDYGHPTLNNVLFLSDVGDNVSYDPIFAQGHGAQAALIALAGVAIGNAALYFFLYRLATRPGVAARPVLLSTLFWLALMCAGNVWSYVPVRAITTHADIAIAARGFGVSPWVQLPFLLIPALYVIMHFFRQMCALCLPAMADRSSARMVLILALTSYWFCVFFVGDAAGGDYGIVAQIIAIVSKYLLFPLSILWLWHRYATSVRHR